MVVITIINVYHVFEVLVVFIEVITVLVFQRSWFLVKQRKTWRVLTAYCAFGILTGFFSIYNPSFILLPATTFLGILFVSLYCYKGHFLSHIFATFVLLIIGVACEISVSLSLAEILQIPLDRLHEAGNDYDRALGMLVSKSMCFVFVVAIATVVKKRKEANTMKMWRVVPLLMCQLILLAMMISIFINTYRMYGALNNLSIVGIAGTLFVSIFLFSYYGILARAHEFERKSQMAQIQLDSQIKHYADVQEREEFIRATEHDMRKFVNVLENMVSNGLKDEACDYLASLKIHVDRTAELVITPHPVVSAILNSCLRKAKTLGATASCEVLIPEAFGVCDIDLTIVLGNVLDNAIEALGAVGPDLAKEISIKLVLNGCFLFFEVVNTYDPEATKAVDGPPHRGYGLKNVRSCVEKYNGAFTTKRESDRFTSTAIISLPSQESD